MFGFFKTEKQTKNELKLKIHRMCNFLVAITLCYYDHAKTQNGIQINDYYVATGGQMLHSHSNQNFLYVGRHSTYNLCIIRHK